MAEPENRQSAEGLSRLIAFADAVVAIALTLLVLPLVDIANDLREDSSVADVVSDNSIELVSFIISFGVIWILWRQHHQTMEYFRAYDRTLINLHFIWLLTIVALPFATALIDGAHIEQANILYIGVLAVSVGSAHRDRRMGSSAPGTARRRRRHRPMGRLVERSRNVRHPRGRTGRRDRVPAQRKSAAVPTAADRPGRAAARPVAAAAALRSVSAVRGPLRSPRCAGHRASATWPVRV